MTRYIGKYGTKRVHKAVLIGMLGPYLAKAVENPEGADVSGFDGIRAAIKADRPAFLMEFLRNFYSWDVTGGKLVSERDDRGQLERRRWRVRYRHLGVRRRVDRGFP